MPEKIIAISMGDPAGIGAEITIKAFLDEKVAKKNIIVFGSFRVLNAVLEKLNLNDKLTLEQISNVNEYQYKKDTITIIDPYPELAKFEIGVVQADCGLAAYKYIESAVSCCLKKEVGFLVTAPINKEALKKAGINFPGHTEILASMSNIENYSMVLFSETLKIIHVTTHISMKKMIDTMSKARIKNVARISYNFMKMVGYKEPKIVIAGLNPHAGENGLFGDEEQEIIIPALKELQEENITIFGPEPPDTIFLRANSGEFDMVIALYHDQGHIAIKMLGMENAINITAGLPFLRTSVDHGTAFNIADRYIANPDSMILAINITDSISI